MSTAKQPRRGPLGRHLARAAELAEKEGVSQELKDEINRIAELDQARDEYCESITTSASKELENLIEETIKHPWDKAHDEGKTTWRIRPGMMSGNLEVQFLKSLISIVKPKRVLELGLFTGCAALAIAEALPADGVVYSCELQPYVIDVARGLIDKSPHGKKVNILKGPAADGMKTLGEKKEKFDVVFIDADKQNYENYYNLIFELDLLSPGGTIIVDNALMGGYPYSHENPNKSEVGPAIEKFNNMVKSKTDIHRVLLPIRDGVMLIRRKEDVTQS
ncbi:hypothetical protein FSP39_011259 [Pinctada imbricata]|uniref:Caffeoyl-CoA O-methyltransferase n=1 Tax=Pinctada imbricata TaxID=66713 RepID=A0AA88XFA6_PINIB|nr:hypothetical protein FSP39_011259 [Pinctada imbricata]